MQDLKLYGGEIFRFLDKQTQTEGNMKKLGTLANAIGVATLALLPVFNAQAETPAHPLLDGTTGTTFRYTGNLVNSIQKTGVPDGDLLGRSAVVQLEKAHKNPQDAARPVYAPETHHVGYPQVVMAVPPAAAYSYAAIPVCLENADGSVAGKWRILTSGQVVPDGNQKGLDIQQMPNKTLCQSWIYPQAVAWGTSVPAKAR